MGKAEASVEGYLVESCRLMGWLALKFVSPGRDKVPDRLVVPIRGAMFFVECKAPGVKMTATAHGRAQLREHARMVEMGQRVYVVSSRGEVDALLAGGRA